MKGLFFWSGLLLSMVAGKLSGVTHGILVFSFCYNALYCLLWAFFGLK